MLGELVRSCVVGKVDECSGGCGAEDVAECAGALGMACDESADSLGAYSRGEAESDGAFGLGAF